VSLLLSGWSESELDAILNEVRLLERRKLNESNKKKQKKTEAGGHKGEDTKHAGGTNTRTWLVFKFSMSLRISIMQSWFLSLTYDRVAKFGII
jgi:hypothetical protein